MKRLRDKSAKQQWSRGFTIVELMIALSVLSTILVIGTILMIQIGNLYTKGINSADLQNATRNVTSDVASALQFSGNMPYPCNDTALATTCYARIPGGEPVNGVYSYCIDTIRYSYVLGKELGTDSDNTVTPHVLWRDTMKNSANCNPVNFALDPNNDPDTTPGSGFELMPPHMRLTRFKILENPSSSGIYLVQVWMAYGDSDLVVTDATAGREGFNSCKGGPGTQFCAVSNLTTTVKRRIQ